MAGTSNAGTVAKTVYETQELCYNLEKKLCCKVKVAPKCTVGGLINVLKKTLKTTSISLC